MSGGDREATPRRRLAVLVVGVSVGALLVGVVAGRSMRSPADAAAARRAPAASAIRVPVEREVLSSTVTGRGDVVFSDAVQLEVADPEAVVTAEPPEVGTEIPEGHVVLEVSERPMLVLLGVVPSYRDLVPGSSGIDVQQLEQALDRLGHRPGPVDGTFDTASQDALERLYATHGYPAPEPSSEGRARLDAARAALEALEQEDPAGALRERELALTAAEAQAAAAIAQADADVAAAGVARRRAESDASRAAERAAAADAGHHPDTGQAPTPAERAELRTHADVAADAVEVARGAEAVARSGRDAVVAQQRATVDTAADAVAAARRTARDASRSTAQQEARDELAAAARAAGAVIPRDEIRFVPALPARLTVVEVELGAPAVGVLGELSGAQLAVDVEVAGADAEQLEPGLPAEVVSRDPAVRVSGTLAAVDEEPDGAAIARVSLTDPAAEQLRGANVQVDLPIATTGGEVLVVPVAAVVGRADGTTWLEVERDGEVVDVEVTTGLQAAGLVEVRPVLDGALDDGDLVTVGVTSGAGGR